MKNKNIGSDFDDFLAHEGMLDSELAAAVAGGLVAGDMYRTSTGDLKIVY